MAAAILLAGTMHCQAQQEHRFKSAEGLVMAGYQGWFNADEDGTGLGWKHYQKGKTFAPGSCTIDLWPDVSEYEKTYQTSFKFEDGSPAEVFSSHDKSTTELHFRWMQEYGLDGVYVQRFVTSIRGGKNRDNKNDILFNCVDAAEKYGRALCVMYDLSGMKPEDVEVFKLDWNWLMDEKHITSSPNYLWHNGKPLVAVWGAGFNDNRKYGHREVSEILDFLTAKGCSILLGVPAHWRTGKMDAVPDPELLRLVEKVDIVHPWMVGRYNIDSYHRFRQLLSDDLEWCEKRGKTYMPVIFPGFSWYNLKGGVAAPLDAIPRHGGAFLWKQAAGAVSLGVKTIYIAMFDEIDEGTAIFKCSNRVPIGESPFLTYQGCESDRYLWLSGMIARMLRNEIPFTETMPQRYE